MEDLCDVVIVGEGIAGLYTALNLNSNLKVYLLNKENSERGSSWLAQGGIAACIKKDDRPYLHMEDTLNAGSRINNIEAVKLMVNEAFKDIKQLIELGVKFDADKNGGIATALEGGHSRSRILRIGGDATGKEITTLLKNKVNERDNIFPFDKIMAAELLKRDRKCIGVKVLKDNKIQNIYSKVTVLAAGGIGAVYKNTTNPSTATGDGIAMASRLKCEI